MKRHESLIPLTHDHHHALARARRLERAAGAEEAERSQETCSFLEFFHDDSVAHFREEEEVIFPLVIDSPEVREPLVRLLLEHVELHALAARLRAELSGTGPTGKTMRSVATLLQAHIRFEEKVLFPFVEEIASAALGGVVLTPRARGARVGSDS